MSEDGTVRVGDDVRDLPLDIGRFVTPASYWVPRCVNESAWTQHAPFAFWLIDKHRPRILAELGTHWGYSYFAFCQAVSRLGTDTKCFAVDTWLGDEHAGFYDEAVYDVVSEHEASNYASFSTLIRSTFDAAADRFQAGSVDLLHIDGRHYYEDVHHDFTTWRPEAVWPGRGPVPRHGGARPWLRRCTAVGRAR